MMGGLGEGLLFCLGNPLLDIQARVDKKFLDKWGLKENDAILCDDKLIPMFDDMEQNYKPVEYIPGGATQNAARVCQWIVGKPNVVTYVGCVGQDHYGQVLEEKARSVGLNVVYQRNPNEKTGTCASCIYGEHRSLCAHLAAANCFTKDHLEVPENRALIEKAQFYYIASFPLTVCPPAIEMVAEHALKSNKPFTMNLSAPFLITVFKEPMLRVLPYVDVLFGNETEAAAFSTEHKFGTDDVREIVRKLADWPKLNKARLRTVVITQGADAIIVSHEGQVKEFAATKFNKDEIVDTNGAGDAFAGGFLAQYIQNKPLEECLRCAVWAADVILRRAGCTFPDKCEYK